jgi:hypothetical protein
MPLSPPNARNPATKKRFAELVGRGLTLKEAGHAVGIAPKTAQRWNMQPEVRKIARETREHLMNPSVRGTLHEALSARKRDGSLDWNARISAARLLMTEPEMMPESDPQEDLPPGTIILLPKDDREQ